MAKIDLAQLKVRLNAATRKVVKNVVQPVIVLGGEHSFNSTQLLDSGDAEYICEELRKLPTVGYGRAGDGKASEVMLGRGRAKGVCSGADAADIVEAVGAWLKDGSDLFDVGDSAEEKPGKKGRKSAAEKRAETPPVSANGNGQ